LRESLWKRGEKKMEICDSSQLENALKSHGWARATKNSVLANSGKCVSVKRIEEKTTNGRRKSSSQSLCEVQTVKTRGEAASGFPAGETG